MAQVVPVSPVIEKSKYDSSRNDRGDSMLFLTFKDAGVCSSTIRPVAGVNQLYPTFDENSSRMALTPNATPAKLIRKISFKLNPDDENHFSIHENSPKGIMRMNEGLKALDQIEGIQEQKASSPTKRDNLKKQLDIVIESATPKGVLRMNEGPKALDEIFESTPKGVLRMNEGLKGLDEVLKENPILAKMAQRRSSIKSPSNVISNDQSTKPKAKSEEYLEETPKGLLRMNEGLNGLDELFEDSPKGLLRMNEGLKPLELLDDFNPDFGE